jgi:hypothetical protein
VWIEGSDVAIATTLTRVVDEGSSGAQGRKEVNVRLTCFCNRLGAGLASGLDGYLDVYLSKSTLDWRVHTGGRSGGRCARSCDTCARSDH